MSFVWEMITSGYIVIPSPEKNGNKEEGREGEEGSSGYIQFNVNF